MPNPAWAWVHLYQKGHGRFPIGLLNKVERLLVDNGYEYEKEAHTSSLMHLNQKVDGLYNFQQSALKMALIRRGGILQIPTGGGKTRTAISFINTLNLPTVVIVPTIDLVNQWKKQVDQEKVHVRTYQGLKNKQYLKQFGLVIFDECISGLTKIRLGNNTEMKMKDLYNDKSITEVLSYNETKQIFEPKKIIRRMKTPLKEAWNKIIIKDSIGGIHEILATDNHRIWTDEGYKRVDKLTRGDILKVYLEPKSYFCSCGKKFKLRQKMARCEALHKHPNMCKNGNKAMRLKMTPEMNKARIKKFCYNHNAKILSIKKTYWNKNMFKYNIEVEDNHNYIANNILISNCHRVAAKTLQTIGMNLSEEAITLGLSATPFMRDDDNLKVEGVLGPVIYKISLRELISEGYLVDALVHFHHLPQKNMDFMDYSDVVRNYIDESIERNGKIIRLAEQSDGPVLILVNHICHGQLLWDFLNMMGEDVIFLNGSSKQRDEKMNHKIIIATSIFDEGIDIPHLETLIIAGGGKSAIKTTQRIGRVLRKFPGKKIAMVHDFADDCKYLKDHYLERRAIYEDDFEVVDVDVE